ncbi:TPA: hypothetical protein VEO38_003805 [Providencia alcalifaciens]|nr:hypothetical protein [Providencia alcalifaciens]HEQ1860206.1 hypothetical protein [Providencia alcalifaciens]
MSLATCYITFENFWGEELRYATITHTDSTYPDEYDFKQQYDIKQQYGGNDTETLYHIEDKKILTDAIKFKYVPNLKDYWNITITTMYGQIWFTESRLPCSIKPEDNHRVIIGVNGQSKRMYVAFPASSTCSTALKKVV